MPMPTLMLGNSSSDERGKILHNNGFDLTNIKRIYEIINIDTKYKRGWKGHKIESRWFICTKGVIEIQVVAIDCFSKTSKNPEITRHTLNAGTLDVLYVPPSYATTIVQNKKNSRVLVMSDSFLNENDDDYRWDINYFD